MKKQSHIFCSGNSLKGQLKILILLNFVCFCLQGFSQDSKDTVVTDLLLVDTTKVHSVKRAAIYSLALPGLGQIYNHRAMPKGKKKAIWKVPLIYAGLGTTMYFALKNNADQRNIKAEYRYRVDQNANLFSEYEAYDSQGLLTLYDQKVRRRDLFYIGFGFVYLLQIADAAVEAHFVNFDVSDNLSMSIFPKVLPSQRLGVGITFNFR